MFVSVADGIDSDQLAAVPGTPILSLEPWRSGNGTVQPEFRLVDTISGRWDARYQAIAATLAAYQRPLLVRFAHEMNGAWSPWGSGIGGNTPAQYVQAWRHVHRLFDRAGATNVLWVWSPNIVRGTAGAPLVTYWPGRAYVDFAGLTGYGVHEQSAAVTFDSDLTQIQRFAPGIRVVMTETGVQTDALKQSWLTSFGSWLRAHPQVAGFVWFEKQRKDGAGADWRFDDTPGHLAAFRASLQTGKVACS